MENAVFVFIPNTLEKTNVGFLSGFVINKMHQTEFYITSDRLNIDPTNCIGYCGMSMNISKMNWIHLNYYEGTLKVNKISCDNTEFNSIFIVYDYRSFKKSEILPLTCTKYGPHFSNLTRALKCDHNNYSRSNIFKYFLYKIVYILLLLTNFSLIIFKHLEPFKNISSTITLTLNSISSLQWSLRSIIKERKINLQVGNLISAKLLDIMLGVLIINFISNHQIDFINIISELSKDLIEDFQELLKFLMGSPVGLKLNYALNNALGNFFLYNIALWQTFLRAINPVMNIALTIIYTIASMGFSFQTAVAADIFRIATFHVYCIYVYAARLYGIQMRVLLSLWKLFLGKKYNPLRKRVDSCQYSHHQLFIGTLTFTILLFLLPTTFLYYVVFTVVSSTNFPVVLSTFVPLKLMLNTFHEMLKWLRCIILSFPLYVLTLWILDSSKVKDCVYVELTDQKKNSEALTLKASLKRNSWWSCVYESLAPINETFHDIKKISVLLHNVAVGDLI